MIVSDIYTTLIVHPLLNLFVVVYSVIPDPGVVILILTILTRLILAPSFKKSLESQKAMNDLQPKLTEVREKYKDDKEGQAKAMMQLYKDHKVNPLSSCLPLLIQLPFLLGLYSVFRTITSGAELHGLYPFVHDPGQIKTMFIGILDVSKSPYPGFIKDLFAGHFSALIHNLYIPGFILALLVGATQYWQSKLMQPAAGSGDATAQAMQAQTTYLLPVVTFLVTMAFPSGLGLYILTTNLFMVGQQKLLLRDKRP